MDVACCLLDVAYCILPVDGCLLLVVFESWLVSVQNLADDLNERHVCVSVRVRVCVC